MRVSDSLWFTLTVMIMKRILIFLVGLAIMSPTISEAQIQEYGRFMPGIKLGAVVTGTTGAHYDSGFSNTHAASGVVAFYGDYRFNDLWALVAEVGFTVIRESGHAKATFEDGTRPKVYVTPVIAKFYIPKAKGLHLTLAPELGITARKLHYPATLWVGGIPPTYKYNPVTFAINSGIGYRFNKGVAFHAEYSAGFTRVIQKNEYSENDTAKDGMFRFTIAIDLYRRRK